MSLIVFSLLLLSLSFYLSFIVRRFISKSVICRDCCQLRLNWIPNNPIDALWAIVVANAVETLNRKLDTLNPIFLQWTVFFICSLCVLYSNRNVLSSSPQSLGILASIPAAILIISLVGLLLYLLTRCCDRKSRKQQSQACQKFTLISTTLFCCGAIGLGKFSNHLNKLLIHVKTEIEI